jgi:hypothetical protein
MATDDVFSADTDALQQGGVNLQQLSDLIAKIRGTLFNALEENPNLGGDGSTDLGKSFAVNYYPGVDTARTFLTDLGTLLDGHGSTTTGLGSKFGDANSEATGAAGGNGRKG